MKWNNLNGLSKLCDITRNGFQAILGICLKAKQALQRSDLKGASEYILAIENRCESIDIDIKQLRKSSMKKLKPIVEIIRVEENFQFGTFGVLRINKEVYCVTLEPPDIENEQDISSIPAQQYECRKYTSPHFGNTFKVSNVPGRKDVLFHPGNFKGDTRGCILLAQHFGKIKEDRVILNSGATFKNFMALMQDINVFHLTIHEVY